MFNLRTPRNVGGNVIPAGTPVAVLGHVPASMLRPASLRVAHGETQFLVSL